MNALLLMTGNCDQYPDDSSRGLTREGAFDAIKIGAGETYIGAFGVFLNGTPMQIGALATFPPLVGAFANSVGVRIVERFKSRKGALSKLIFTQGALWAPMALLPAFMGQRSEAVYALLAVAILYQITIGIISPIWNSLAGDVVPQQARGRFFGNRNRWMAILTFTALAAAGGVIQIFTSYGATMLGFVTIFLIASVARLISARQLKQVADPAIHVPEDSKFTFWQFISRVRHSNFVRFVLFVSGMNFAVAISGPYYAVYMLRDLQLSYLQYTCILSAAIAAQFVVMRSWGSLSDEYGNKKILKVCGWLAAWNPVFWLLSGNVWFLVIIQFYSGFCWAGFNLAAANFVFDAVTPAKRARCIAYQALINGSLVFIGSQAGALLSTAFPESLALHIGGWVPASPFLLVFLLSALGRLAVMHFLFKTFKEVRVVGHIRSREMLIRVATVRPISGATFTFLGGRPKGD